MAKQKATIFFFMGLSGSGKSYYIANQILSDFPKLAEYLKSKNLGVDDIVVSPDNLRRELTGDVNNHEKEAHIWMNLVHKRIKETLAKSDYVIFDATNVAKRKKFIEKYKYNNVIGVVFEPNMELSIERITEDINNNVDRSNVPIEALEIQYEKFRNSIIYFKWDGVWNKVIKKKIRERLMKEESFSDVIFPPL